MIAPQIEKFLAHRLILIVGPGFQNIGVEICVDAISRRVICEWQHGQVNATARRHKVAVGIRVNPPDTLLLKELPNAPQYGSVRPGAKNDLSTTYLHRDVGG